MGYRLAITMLAATIACHTQAAPPATPQPPPAGIKPATQDHTAMIGHIVTFKITPEREAESIAFLTDFAATIEKNEPGTLMFYFFRSATDPLQVIVVEMYKDQEARDIHKKLLETVRPKMVQLFDMSTFKTDIQVGPPIVGVMR
jgi:quinol monooxygenase YgiN